MKQKTFWAVVDEKGEIQKCGFNGALLIDERKYSLWACSPYQIIPIKVVPIKKRKK